MSAYTDSLAAGNGGHFGLAVAMTPVASDVFGHFGVGITLATNFLLVVLDELGNPVDSGTPYTLEYYDPVSGANVALQLYHNPSVPYQTTLPENQAITFSFTSIDTRYAPNQMAQMTIGPGVFGVLRVSLAYPPGSVYTRILWRNVV